MYNGTEMSDAKTFDDEMTFEQFSELNFVRKDVHWMQ